MNNKLETHILKLSCKDQIGIVAKISSMLAASNCNIVESKQFTDQKNGNFFIRQSFTLLDDNMLPNLKNNLEDLANCPLISVDSLGHMFWHFRQCKSVLV